MKIKMVEKSISYPSTLEACINSALRDMELDLADSEITYNLKEIKEIIVSFKDDIKGLLK